MQIESPALDSFKDCVPEFKGLKICPSDSHPSGGFPVCPADSHPSGGFPVSEYRFECSEAHGEESINLNLQSKICNLKLKMRDILTLTYRTCKVKSRDHTF
jgi:hypothetical protein